MGLNSDKTSEVFCINICCFSTRFYIYFVPQWHSHPSFMKIVDVFLTCTPHKTRTFTVRLAVTTKYQRNGFAAEVLLGRDYPRVVPIGPIVTGVIVYKKKLYIAFSILEHDGMRPPKLRPSRSICRRVMAFRILSNNDRQRKKVKGQGDYSAHKSSIISR